MTEMLYPFLDSGAETPVAELHRSTAEKADEIVALRRAILAADGARLAACASRMAEAFRAGGRLFAFGNGGSSTDAQDVAALFLDPGDAWRPLPALALTADVAVVTALANDVGFEVVFARPLAAFGRAGDIALGLSTSGDSVNLVRAFDQATRLGMLTIGLAGHPGGRMAELDGLDHLFTVPSSSVHRVQEAQTTVYHALWELTQDRLS